MNKIDINKIKEDKKLMNLFQIEGDFTLLGHGEYNLNYSFYSAKYGKDMLLRIATASQMALEKQITYEYKALKMLENSGRTPQVYYFNDNKEILPYGYLVMEFLPGKPLDYKKNLNLAAEILADIHNLKIEDKGHLIEPEAPLQAIYEECQNMFNKYRKYENKDVQVQEQIEKLLKMAEKIQDRNLGRKTIINTELNSGNFLINGIGKENYLIDWEKPLYAYPVQDLGHFLAPTTTFWKTDHILSIEEIDLFLDSYIEKNKDYKNKEQIWKDLKPYIIMSCLRGITWSAMAYVEYQDPEKIIAVPYTYEKIKAYLSMNFLTMLEKDYING